MVISRSKKTDFLIYNPAPRSVNYASISHYILSHRGTLKRIIIK